MWRIMQDHLWARLEVVNITSIPTPLADTQSVIYTRKEEGIHRLP